MIFSEEEEWSYATTYKIDEEAIVEPISNATSDLECPTNLFRGDVIFNLFNNLQEINIKFNDYMKADDHKNTYMFSFGFLLSMISESPSLQTITIEHEKKWIHRLKVWSALSRFKQHHFDIQYVDNFDKNQPSFIIITRQ